MGGEAEEESRPRPPPPPPPPPAPVPPPSSSSSSPSSESTFFAERDEAFELVSVLVSSSSSSSIGDDEALSKFRAILDRYLECPSLLDRHLEPIVSTLSGRAREIIHDSFRDGGTDGDVRFPRELRRILSCLYALSKVRGRKRIKKLFPHGVDDVEPVLRALRSADGLSRRISSSSSAGAAAAAEEEAKPWESSYVLLSWLDTLSLVPFGLDVIDSSSSSIVPSSFSRGGGEETTTSLASLILSTSESHLTDAGPTRDVAADCVASLLSRPDTERDMLEAFVSRSSDVLADRLRDDDGRGGGGGGKEVFRTLGYVRTLAAIFKSGNRSNLVASTGKHIEGVEKLWERALLLADRASSPSPSSSSRKSGGGTLLLRKLLTKFFARVGAAHLPPRVAPWRYRRGRRTLLENLSSFAVAPKGPSSSSVAATAKTIVHEERPVDLPLGNNDDESKYEDDLFHVPDRVEDATDRLLTSLSDPSTAVRWSAAKGIGRVVERLPSICGDDVLDAVLLMTTKNGAEDDDDAWHGACLALAELSRRGLLLPRRLGEVAPTVVRAMQYDVRRNRTSAGANVRDAACYACWAFARAYAPSVLRPHVAELAKSMVLTCLFDREVNCRRAASAAFQECVGRQGAQNFKHGISIVTAADYFSLGNRTEAYTSVSIEVAAFHEYRTAILEHLYTVKLRHWDPNVRTLSSEALRQLVKLIGSEEENAADGTVGTVVVPYLLRRSTDENLFVRHGAVLGLAEILLALGELRDSSDDGNGKVTSSLGLSEDVTSSLAELVPAIETARLYRGRGGEAIRSAVMRYVECLSLAGLPLTVRQQVRHLDSIDSCLRHPDETVQLSASRALGALTRSYFPVGPNGPSSRLQNRVVNRYCSLIEAEENPAITRGFAMGLGFLPAKLLAFDERTLHKVLDCLIDASRPDRMVGDEGDAETRRNALRSLRRICLTVGVGGGTKSDDDDAPRSSSEADRSPPTVGLNRNQIDKVFGTYLSSLEDYNTDRRGDVGSWSRIEATVGLESLVRQAVEASVDVPHRFFPPSASTTTMEEEEADGNGSEEEEESLRNDVRNRVSARPLCELPPTVPPASDRLRFLQDDSETNVERCLRTNRPLRKGYERRDAETRYFDERLCRRIVGALLKQLSEKLDSVRSVAGSALERLLFDDRPRLPFVPNRDALTEALGLRRRQSNRQRGAPDGECRNWSSPSITFPLVMRVASDVDEFFPDVVEGMVVSVGGLTESVTKASEAALFGWCRAATSSGDKGSIRKLGNVLLGLFPKHRKQGRVILPLLKTLDKLLSRGCLDDLLLGERDSSFSSDHGGGTVTSSSFPEALLGHLKTEMKGCGDVRRLLAAVSVSSGLLGCRQRSLVQNRVLPFLLEHLGHPYPRVRRHAAEELYARLLEDDAALRCASNPDDVICVLANVAWDGALEYPDNVRECRNRIADAMDVRLSPKIRDGAAASSKRKKANAKQLMDDEFGYASLVNDAAAVGR